MTTEIKALRYPIYMLYYIDDVYKDPIFSNDFENKIREDYSQEIIDEIKKSLAWALQNPDYDFSKILPNMNHTNKDILYFLEKYAEKIERV